VVVEKGKKIDKKQCVKKTGKIKKIDKTMNKQYK
jgi:hypothetical protein